MPAARRDAPPEDPSQRAPVGDDAGKRAARLQELGVVLLSGLVVLLGAASSREVAAPAAAPSAQAASLPPALPAGAPPWLEELPADDERSAGCHFADRGFGDYGAYRKLALPGGSGRVVWRALVRAGRGVASDGSFRLLVHFHGAEPVRRQLAPEGLDLVIVALDAGVGSRAYDQALADPATFGEVLAAVEHEVAAANHLPAARARTVILSSWSAGYGAVAQILGHGSARVDAVVLLDSLYAGYVGDGAARETRLDRARVAPFLGAARAALGGGAPFFLTHTAIATPGYGSTAEVASYLLDQLGLEAAPVLEDVGAGTFPLKRTAESGQLWIKGYAGADRDAHCAQLHLLPGILRDAILPRLP
jgi:hypothetical protein